MPTRIYNLKEYTDYPVIRRVLPSSLKAHRQPTATFNNPCIVPSVFKVPGLSNDNTNPSLPIVQQAMNMLAIARDEEDSELIHEDYGSFDLVIGISERCNRTITCNLYIPNLSSNFIGCLLLLDHFDEYTIDRINVQQRYRRMGFGKKLIEEAIGYIRRTLKRTILLQAPIEDEGCEKFFQKCGFQLGLKSASLRITDIDLHQTELIDT